MCHNNLANLLFSDMYVSSSFLLKSTYDEYDCAYIFRNIPDYVLKINYYK